MKLTTTLVFMAALLAHPAGGDANKLKLDRTPTPFRKYPTAQQNQAVGLSNEERILLLERDSELHEAEDRTLEEHMTQHLDDLMKGQGVQDGQIRQLESRLDVVYRFGALIAFVLTLSVPFFLWILNRSQAHNTKIANALATLAKDVQSIKIVCNMKNGPESCLVCSETEIGGEASCQS